MEKGPLCMMERRSRNGKRSRTIVSILDSIVSSPDSSNGKRSRIINAGALALGFKGSLNVCCARRHAWLQGCRLWLARRIRRIANSKMSRLRSTTVHCFGWSNRSVSKVSQWLARRIRRIAVRARVRAVRAVRARSQTWSLESGLVSIPEPAPQGLRTTVYCFGCVCPFYCCILPIVLQEFRP